jgi:hypothetical protein
MRVAVGYLTRKIAREAPQTAFVRDAEAKWKALAPAIDPRYYPIEILLQLFQSLPSEAVHVTGYNQSARQISVEGEADTPALAYEFAEKVKKNPSLQIFRLEMVAPRILSNGHAQFRLEGRPR